MKQDDKPPRRRRAYQDDDDAPPRRRHPENQDDLRRRIRALQEQRTSVVDDDDNYDDDYEEGLIKKVGRYRYYENHIDKDAGPVVVVEPTPEESEAWMERWPLVAALAKCDRARRRVEQARVLLDKHFRELLQVAGETQGRQQLYAAFTQTGGVTADQFDEWLKNKHKRRTAVRRGHLRLVSSKPAVKHRLGAAADNKAVRLPPGKIRRYRSPNNDDDDGPQAA
jgi:hypothetical protein